MNTLYREALIASSLLAWVFVVIGPVTKRLYNHMVDRGLSQIVAIYLNRKIMHILTGGLIALLIPVLFSTPVIPIGMAVLLAVILYIPHKTGRILYWFQTNDNMFEVHFCVAWGLAMLLGWLLTGGDLRLGIVPILYMSFGDAVTGIVRNILFGERTKSWWGNLAMAAVCTPIGASLGPWGLLSALVASIIEHFEFGFIDDNITVPLSSFLILYLSYPNWSW